MDNIKQQLDELREMSKIPFLDDETKSEIDNLIKLTEGHIRPEDYLIGDFMSKTQLKFINKSNNENPIYAKNGDSGFDLRADLLEPVTLKPLERRLINTGLFFDLPNGYDMEIRSRSGLTLKHGIMVLNSPGTIDLGYTGEICVILINLGNEDFTINPGDRIAQALLRHSMTDNNVDLVEVTEIEKTTVRGNNGFGHSGVK